LQISNVNGLTFAVVVTKKKSNPNKSTKEFEKIFLSQKSFDTKMQQKIANTSKHNTK